MSDDTDNGFWLTNPASIVRCCKNISVSIMLNIATLVVILISVILLIMGFEFSWLFLLLGIIIILIVYLVNVISIDRFRCSKKKTPHREDVYIHERGMTPIHHSNSKSYHRDMTMIDDSSSSDDESIEYINHSDPTEEYQSYSDPSDEYILPSSLLPSQAEFTFGNSLDTSQRFMNDQVRDNAVTFRKSIMENFLTKQQRWNKFGCCPSPYAQGPPVMIV